MSNSAPTIANSNRYLKPDFASQRLVNPLMRGLVRLGFAPSDGATLQVRGRITGEWRTVIVNIMEIDGRQILVAPRGHTQWVRNLRTAGDGRIRSKGRRSAFTAIEIDDETNGPLLQEYLTRYTKYVQGYFGDITPDSSDETFAAAANGFPIFEITMS